MGAISILQFFSKLSQGTAQMSTSRQALRLGQRLSLGRLLGFYYTHIGYYAGQVRLSPVKRNRHVLYLRWARDALSAKPRP